MTDTVETPLDLTAIVKRRLVGLVVLLVVAFVISLLLRARPNSPEQLPSVVIPLNGNAPAVDPAIAASTAPLLDEPEPQAGTASKAAEDQPPAAAAPASEKPAKAAEPAKAAVAAARPKPAVEKPAAVAASKPATPAARPAAKPATPQAKPEAAARWFVAVGAYKDPMAAQAIVSRIRQSGFSASSVAITSAGEKLHRVRAGPFGAKPDAESARATLIVEGLTKATIVSEK